MKITFIALCCILLIALPLTSCKSLVKGSGELKTRDFPQSDFSSVQAADGFEVKIAYGPTFNVTITADDNLLEHLKVSVKGEVLKLGLNRADYIDATVKAVVTMPSLRKLDLSGNAKGSVSGFNTRAGLELKISGGSSLIADNMTTGDIVLTVADASKVSGLL